MYLTRLSLDALHPEALRALADTHALHRLVYLGFPDQDEGGAGRPLYRPEPPSPRQARHAVVLVQSCAAPPHVERWLSLDYVSVLGPKKFCLRLERGQRLQFRLRANPTVRRWEYRTNRGGRPEGKRVGLYTEDEQRAWLERKGATSGFEVVEVRLAPARTGVPECIQAVAIRDEKVYGLKPRRHCDRNEHNSGRQDLQHLAVMFDGTLRVTDPGALQTAVQAGIGTAKGFGFGLLSLAPAR